MCLFAWMQSNVFMTAMRGSTMALFSTYLYTWKHRQEQQGKADLTWVEGHTSTHSACMYYGSTTGLSRRLVHLAVIQSFVKYEL